MSNDEQSSAEEVKGAERPMLTIVLLPDGQNVGVHGPLANIALCYFMLERAKDAVRDYAKPRLVKPDMPPMPPSDFRGSHER